MEKSTKLSLTSSGGSNLKVNSNFAKIRELILKGKLKSLKKFIKTKNELVHCSNEFSQTPLHLAVIEGHLEIVKYLIDKKADVNAQDRQGWTPIFCACSANHLEIIDILIDNGAQLNIEAFNGSTFLHLFVRMFIVPEKIALYKQFFIKCMTPKFKVEVNHQNHIGETPLHLACFKGVEESVVLLISFGADCNIPNSDGETCLHSSIRSGKIEIIKHLLNANANAKIVGKHGSVFDIVRNSTNQSILSYFRDNYPNEMKNKPKFLRSSSEKRVLRLSLSITQNNKSYREINNSMIDINSKEKDSIEIPPTPNRSNSRKISSPQINSYPEHTAVFYSKSSPINVSYAPNTAEKSNSSDSNNNNQSTQIKGQFNVPNRSISSSPPNNNNIPPPSSSPVQLSTLSTSTSPSLSSSPLNSNSPSSLSNSKINSQKNINFHSLRTISKKDDNLVPPSSNNTSFPPPSNNINPINNNIIQSITNSNNNSNINNNINSNSNNKINSSINNINKESNNNIKKGMVVTPLSKSSNFTGLSARKTRSKSVKISAFDHYNSEDILDIDDKTPLRLARNPSSHQPSFSHPPHNSPSHQQDKKGNLLNSSNSPQKKAKSKGFFKNIWTSESSNLTSSDHGHPLSFSTDSADSLSHSHHKSLHDRYKICEMVGKGANATVYKAVDNVDYSLVAIKQFNSTNTRKSYIDSVMAEMKLLQNIHCDNVVKYICSYQYENNINFVMEYVGGSLNQRIKYSSGLSELQIVKYIFQLLIGLNYLHQHGVIHRDIKRINSANILINKEGKVKIADFGVAYINNNFNQQQNNNNPTNKKSKFAKESTGSPYWMAPEVILLQDLTTKSDIWSLGCTIIEMISGNPPYFELDPMCALFAVVKDDIPPIPTDISVELFDFVKQCLLKNPELRPSSEGLISHPLIIKHRAALCSLYSSNFFLDSIEFILDSPNNIFADVSFTTQ